MEHFNDLIINDDYYDLDDLNDNLDILKNIMNLRELNFKDNHQLTFLHFEEIIEI